MQNDNNNNKQQPTPTAGQGYDPTARDFQRTEEETDNISESEVEATNKKEENKRTEQANTEPNKNKVW